MRRSAHKKGVLLHDNAQEKNSRKFEQKGNYVTRYMREGNAQKCKQKRSFFTRYAQERKTLIFRAKLN